MENKVCQKHLDEWAESVMSDIPEELKPCIHLSATEK